MNLSNTAVQPFGSNLVSSQNLAEETHPPARVGPCEFERLLQRAMEILNARARSAAASGS
jgi:hypothetical protein